MEEISTLDVCGWVHFSLHIFSTMHFHKDFALTIIREGCKRRLCNTKIVDRVDRVETST